MDFENKIFPYPILNNNSDDYINSHFNTDIEVKKVPNGLRIISNFDLLNPEITDLINRDMAEFVVHFECSYTCFRKIESTKDPSLNTFIKSQFLKDRLNISTFIVAKKDIRNYSNRNFNSDYKGLNFEIKRGNILALGKSIEVTINTLEDDLESFPSIFSICRVPDNLETGLKYNIDSQKIEIGLSDEIFSKYNILSQNIDLKAVTFAEIIIPALQYVFERLENNGISDYQDYRWFKTIKQTLKKYDIDLNEEALQNYESYYLAHTLLGSPLLKSLEAIINFNVDDEE